MVKAIECQEMISTKKKINSKIENRVESRCSFKWVFKEGFLGYNS